MNSKIWSLCACVLLALLAGALLAAAQPKLLIRDSPADTGAEPDTAIDPMVNPGGEMWLSQDIWVTQTPMPGYAPYPFTSTPMWLPANPNQNPFYRDPLLSQPNYVYVRIQNVGTVSSLGTEELHVYWAKGSTGLSWPSQWVDYKDTFCGPSILYGFELTKPRRNIADPSVPLSEVKNYLRAINAIAHDAAYQFPDGTQFWYKQNPVHYFVAVQHNTDPTFSAHGSDGFFPWHREFINRYEIALRHANPTVTLFYWDWTTDPTTAWPASLQTAVTAASPDGIGTFSGTISSYFNVAADVVSPPAPLFPLVTRFTATVPSAPEPTPDATILTQTTYSDTGAWDEGRASAEIAIGGSAHNHSHPFIGGAGNMQSLSYAAQDPFFFLLHANVDRLWSAWQRHQPVDPSRYDPSVSGGNALAYAGTMNDMSKPMAPWNGLILNGTTPSASNPLSTLTPWTQTPGDETNYKPANDNSVVFPPVYDDSPVTVPVLAPGESVVIEIPWYPPNPADFSCSFFSDPGHVCLLARITTSATSPYGMDFAEGSDIYSNAKNNSKIAWRNETVLDGGTSPPGPLITEPVLIRNLSSNNTLSQLVLKLPLTTQLPLTDFGNVLLDLGPTLYARWVADGSAGLGFQTNGGTQLRLLGTNGFVGLTLMPNEAQQVQVALKLHNQYPDPQGQVFYADLLQYGGGVPGATNPLVGGQRFTFNFNQLDIVPKGATWRYWAYGKYPGEGWNIVDFNDETWASGEAKLGYGIGDERTVIGQGPAAAPFITTWFRYDFTLNDPAFFTNQPLWLQLETYDGAVVYLNGMEIARLRMPAGPVSPDTRANAAVRGAAAETFYPFDVSGFASLLKVRNVLAVEVHLADTNAPHLGLDAELAGNVFAPRFPPKVAFLSLTNGGLSAQYLVGQEIRLAVEALGPVNPVKGVTFYSDGTAVGTIMNPPYVLGWQAPPGLHQLTAEAFDAAGQTGRAFATVRVLTNLPPVVYMTNPAPGAVFTANSVISLGATASELGGTIARVDFYYVRHGPAINNPYHLAGTALTPPYSAQITNLPPACYMLSAVATDTFGQRSYSVPVAIFVTPKPTISISVLRPYLIANWTPTNAVLEQAVSPVGPWQPLPDATSPYGFLPARNAPSMFYRAVLPPSAYEALCNALLLKP